HPRTWLRDQRARPESRRAPLQQSRGVSTPSAAHQRLPPRILRLGVPVWRPVPTPGLVRGAGYRLRHVDSELRAPRDPARRVLYGDAVLHRPDPGAARDDDAGLLLIAHSERHLESYLAHPDRVGHRQAWLAELHRSPGLSGSGARSARLPGAARRVI